MTRCIRFDFSRDWRLGPVLGVATVAVAWWSPSVVAVTLFQKSAFTTVDRKVCQLLRPNEQAYLCPGLDAYPLYFSEIDGRTFIASGTAPETSQAARQTLAAFNTPFVHRHDRATVEWRFTIKDKRRVPFAMIIRYFTTVADGRSGEVLVVTRIAGSEACHVAYVDALANPDAIVLARNIADGRARREPCQATAAIEGTHGQSPM